MKHLIKSLILLSVMLITACDGPREWVDGYSLTFLQQGTSEIVLRYFEEGQWKETTRVSSKPESGLFQGVGLARELGGLRSVLGFTNGDELFIHDGLGLVFGEFPQEPDHKMGGVTSAPAIIHTGDSEFLIAYRAQDKTVRLQPYNPGPGFGDQIALSVEGNDNVINRPALAYHNGRLVVVWGQFTSPPRFRYAAADYQPGDDAVTVVATGEPPSGSYNVPAPQADPALTHDGAEMFYLAVLGRSSWQTLGKDHLQIYSSTDGKTWTFFDGYRPDDSDFQRDITNVEIAAQPSGEILVAITASTSASGGTRVFRFLRGSGWTELDPNTVFMWESNIESFSLIRHQYLR
jgi:hypothetical protein